MSRAWSPAVLSPPLGRRRPKLIVSLALQLALGCGSDLPSDDGDAPGPLDAHVQPATPGSEAGPSPVPDASGTVRDAGTPGASMDAGSRPVGGDAAQADASPDSGRYLDGGRDARVEPSDGAAPDAGSLDAGMSARDAGKFVGNITTSGQVRSDFAGMWNQITPENEGKWGSVERERNQMSWAGLDRVHDYARQHGLAFKQHTLVWGSQQPSWLGALSAAEQAAEVEEWIRLFCERYPDVELIDVVNEPPPHTTPVYMNALGGAGSSGYDWIVRSFQLARKYCPRAILILNDYNNIEYGGDNTRFIAIAKAVKSAGAPIDAVGAQAHDAFKLPTSTVQQLLDKLASETGLPVYVTEYDLDLADDAQQRQVMESQLTMFWRNPNVKGITLWGYVSGATWRPNTGLMAANGTKRPALTWLLDFLQRER